MTETTSDVKDNLVRVSFAVMARLSQVAAAHEVSLTQLRVLAILRDRQPKMAELATYLGLDRSSVTGLIDRAEARGLVRRQASGDDGRAVRVGLTPDGERLAAQGAAEIDRLVAPLTDRLGGSDQQRLGALLERLL
jgi:DNA-binding MarR family transcriptional regulator